MVYDYLANSEQYESLSAGIAAGFNLLKSRDLTALEPGDYPIFGDDMILKIQSYDSKPVEQARLEIHRRYIDIQYIISGEEKIAIATPEQVGEELEVRAEKDIWFHAYTDGDPMTLRPGQFMLIFPGMAHASGIAVDAPVPVKKALLKVAIDYEP